MKNGEAFRRVDENGEIDGQATNLYASRFGKGDGLVTRAKQGEHG